MFRIWGKLIKNNKFKADMVVAIDEPTSSLDVKITESIDKICYEFDLQRPLWFEKNTKEINQFSRTSFYDDQFIEAIDFDYLEIEIIETDDK